MFKRESKSVKHRQWSVHQDWQSLPRMCHFKTNDGTVRTHSAARAVITGRNTDCSILFGDNKREGKGFRGYENTLIPSVSSVYDKM